MLLTVSKDPSAGGEFRSIKEALAKVTRPRMTIRVLDSETYEETVSISKSQLHAGITLESLERATITPAPSGGDLGAAIIVENVSNVTIRGFKLHADRPGVYLLVVMLPAPGV